MFIWIRRVSIVLAHQRLVYSAVLLCSVCLSVAAWACWPAVTQAQADVVKQTGLDSALEVGKPIERVLDGAERHTYQLTLDKHQYVRVIVREIGLDIKATLLDAEGRKLTEVDNGLSPLMGQEKVHWIAEKAGRFRIEIYRPNVKDTGGHYIIQLTDQRSAAPQDYAQVEANQLANEAAQMLKEKKLDKARELLQQALSLYEEKLGATHIDYVSSLTRIAVLSFRVTGLSSTESLMWKALAAAEKRSDPDWLEIAQALNFLAGLSGRNGDYAKAVELAQRTIAIVERRYSTSHVFLVAPLATLAGGQQALEGNEQAEQTLKRIQELLRINFGANHPIIFGTVYDTAFLRKLSGDYAGAESLYLQVLAAWEKYYGIDDPRTVSVLNDLGHLYRAQRDFDKAERFFLRSREILEKKFGAESLEVAGAWNDLGLVRGNSKKYAEAEQFFRHSLKLTERHLGKENIATVGRLFNLGISFYAQKQFDKAERYYQKALAITERTYGIDKMASVRLLLNLAMLQRVKRNYAESEQLYLKALSIREKALGPHHIDIADSYLNISALYRIRRDYPQATSWALRCLDVVERNAARAVSRGSERQRATFMKQFDSWLDDAISLNIEAGAEAIDLGLLSLLRYKGRALDGMGLTLASLRASGTEQTKELFEKLAAVRAQLSALTTGNETSAGLQAYLKRRREIERQIEQIEEEIGTFSTGAARPASQITIEAVQKALPQDAVLIEFVRHEKSYVESVQLGKVQTQDLGKPHSNYTAYVLPPTGKPELIDLGKADVIDQAIDNLRQALSNRQRDDFKFLARKVDQLVMQPLRKHLGGARHLLISPDGQLHLLPFAALVDEQEHFLIESFLVTYLTSGRDLLRLQVKQANNAAAIVFANPAFDDTAIPLTPANPQGSEKDRDLVKKTASQSSKPQINRPISLADAFFKELPGTADEAAAIKALLPQATVLTGAQATESALKQVQHPQLLHIATHGFFLKDLAPPTDDSERLLVIRTNSGAAAEEEAPDTLIENPLLRSGLALAGANKHKSGNEDGILTAMEAAGLDLWGTKLVVLSACDTGLGEIRNGEGVYGLRRAFVLAGTESLVMSMWPVSDRGTKELMEHYYRRLQSSEGRSEALRQVQLEMIRSGKQYHPYYWASFIQSGEWANLDGQR